VALHAIAKAGVFLRTTHYDGDSISLREVLHLGTPTVASENNMRPPGATLFQARDPDSLVRAIHAALTTQPGCPGSGWLHI